MRIVDFLVGLTLVFNLGCNSSSGSAPASETTAALNSAKPAPSAATPAPSAAPAKEASNADACVLALTGKTVESLGKKRVEYTLTNKTTRDVKFCLVTMYAYGKDDKIVGWTDDSITFTEPLAAGSTKTMNAYVEERKGTKSLAGEPDITFEGVVSEIHFADGQKSADASLVAPGRPKGGKR